MNSIFKFFFDPSFKVKADSWNISVQQMLKKYIYEPVYYSKDLTDEKIKKKQQFLGQNATVLVSAIWHGLYPAYYITFFNWVFVLQFVNEVFRLRKNSPKFSKIYDMYGIGKFVELLFATYYMAYFGQIFILMTSEKFLVPLLKTYYIPGFFMYFIWIVGVQMGYIGKIGRMLEKPRQKVMSSEEKKTDEAEKT